MKEAEHGCYYFRSLEDFAKEEHLTLHDVLTVNDEQEFKDWVAAINICDTQAPASAQQQAHLLFREWQLRKNGGRRHGSDPCCTFAQLREETTLSQEQLLALSIRQFKRVAFQMLDCGLAAWNTLLRERQLYRGGSGKARVKVEEAVATSSPRAAAVIPNDDEKMEEEEEEDDDDEGAPTGTIQHTKMEEEETLQTINDSRAAAPTNTQPLLATPAPVKQPPEGKKTAKQPPQGKKAAKQPAKSTPKPTKRRSPAKKPKPGQQKQKEDDSANDDGRPLKERIVAKLAGLQVIGVDQFDIAILGFFVGYRNAKSKAYAKALMELRAEGCITRAAKGAIGLAQPAPAGTVPMSLQEMQASLERELMAFPNGATVWKIFTLLSDGGEHTIPELMLKTNYKNPKSKAFAGAFFTLRKLGFLQKRGLKLTEMGRRFGQIGAPAGGGVAIPAATTTAPPTAATIIGRPKEEEMGGEQPNPIVGTASTANLKEEESEGHLSPAVGTAVTNPGESSAQ